jgi:hypothetical protein
MMMSGQIGRLCFLVILLGCCGPMIALGQAEKPIHANPTDAASRIARYMALAIYYENLIRQGHVHDYAEIAALGHVTRARVTQIMNLRLLAPDLQERLLLLIRIVGGRDALCLRSLQPIALESDWRKQRECWNKVMSS